MSLASASTVDIGAQNSQFVDITGTTTITSLGTTYNGPRFLRFTGALTLTHNTTSLNLPSGSNITTVAGDSCIAVPNQALNGWNIISYQSFTGDQNSIPQYITGVAGTDTITGSLSPAITAYTAGQTFRFVAAGANTGAATININGLGAKSITKSGTTALDAGDIASGAAIQIVYDGTRFQLTSGAGGGGASAGGVIYENKRVLTSSFTGTSAKSGHMVGPLTVNTGATLTIPTGEALMIFNPSTSGTGTTDVLTTGAQTFQGQKTFAVQPNIAAVTSMVRVQGANGYGSSSTKIRRFTNVLTNQGSDITYADSATLGGSFTINTSGVYAIAYLGTFTGANWLGVSLNTTTPTTSITSLTAAETLASAYTIVADGAGTAVTTLYLPAGSVIRPHTDGAAAGSNAAYNQFTITRVA